MDIIHEILLRKNPPHVATIKNRTGELETLFDGPINIEHILQGMAELNKNGIVLLDIKIGNNTEGITKIKNIESAGVFKNDKWLKEPFYEIEFPETDIIPFKSDSWALGEFIIRTKTGKTIPKRFLKSQNLLNKFIGDDETLKHLLVLDPVQRSYTWDLVKSNDNCIIQ